MKGVRKTKKGIIVNQRCNETVKACYYKNGNYPVIPLNPDHVINDYAVTEAQRWRHDLEYYKPDRVYNWMD